MICISVVMMVYLVNLTMICSSQSIWTNVFPLLFVSGLIVYILRWKKISYFYYYYIKHKKRINFICIYHHFNAIYIIYNHLVFKGAQLCIEVWSGQNLLFQRDSFPLIFQYFFLTEKLFLIFLASTVNMGSYHQR